MADLSVKIAGVTMKNPMIAASGTVGFGQEYGALFPISTLGGISTKGTTLHRRPGNPPPRIAETPAGLLNSVGLQNPGADAFLAEELPRLKQEDLVVIANLAGSTLEEYVAVVEKVSDSDVDMIELNISCPNVKAGGAAFGVSAACAAEVTAAVRKVCKKPLIIKLSPNVSDIAEIARAVEAAGADAISLINTLLGMRIDIRTRRPILRNNVGGLSGLAVFPVAVRMVWQASRAVKIPVIGMGGISSAEDAVEMMLAGASAFQIGSALFADPTCPVKILEDLNRYLDEQGIASVTELTGMVNPY